MKKLTRTVKRGQKIMVDDTQIEVLDCDRGRVTVRVVHEESVKIEVKVSETPLSPALVDV